MKAIFNTFTSNEIFLLSFVAIDYNHVEFSLILTQGTNINSLFLKKKWTKLYIGFDILSRGHNYFHENNQICAFHITDFLMFRARHLILGVIFGKVHCGGVYIKWLFEKHSIEKAKYSTCKLNETWYFHRPSKNKSRSISIFRNLPFFHSSLVKISHILKAMIFQLRVDMFLR